MERVSPSRRYETAGRANDAPPTNLLFWSSLFEGLGRSDSFLQLQIRQMIVTAIEDGRLPLGVRMPSSRDLAGISSRNGPRLKLPGAAPDLGGSVLYQSLLGWKTHRDSGPEQDGDYM